MINRFEMKLFHKELKRLEKDYERAEDIDIKEMILSHIELMKTAMAKAKVEN
ncbi:hypothetical protein [Halobacillus sp. Marseille-Q1614]|uniref:hypothetical protein n=1 Tax=Halobacillus sp. Marseille-Q1614 TaxID=2709134 RepID=UPI00156DE750|nr:hypothetical protein [Halobacillus sp. Marseille-Q1614]